MTRLLKRIDGRGDRRVEAEVDDRHDEHHAAQVGPGQKPGESLPELTPCIRPPGGRAEVGVALGAAVGDSGALDLSPEKPGGHGRDEVAQGHDRPDEPAARAEEQPAQRPSGQLESSVASLVRGLRASHGVVRDDLFQRALPGDIEEAASGSEEHIDHEEGQEGEGTGEGDEREGAGQHHTQDRAEEHEQDAPVPVGEDPSDEGQQHARDHPRPRDDAGLSGIVGDDEGEERNGETEES
ncbi:Uncharacterised protein [Mycobacterium tuberculosis]|nr:Uncharacterised protein [Mycobacterium tuberculosis]